MKQATQRPWQRCSAREGKCPCLIIWSADGDTSVATGFGPKSPIACVHQEWGDAPDMIYGGMSAEEALENADLIVTAVNEHDALKAVEQAARPMMRAAVEVFKEISRDEPGRFACFATPAEWASLVDAVARLDAIRAEVR